MRQLTSPKHLHTVTTTACRYFRAILWRQIFLSRLLTSPQRTSALHFQIWTQGAADLPQTPSHCYYYCWLVFSRHFVAPNFLLVSWVLVFPVLLVRVAVVVAVLVAAVWEGVALVRERGRWVRALWSFLCVCMHACMYVCMLPPPPPIWILFDLNVVHHTHARTHAHTHKTHTHTHASPSFESGDWFQYSTPHTHAYIHTYTHTYTCLTFIWKQWLIYM
jgi:hypothetical protein